MSIDLYLTNVNSIIFFVRVMFYKNVRNKGGDEGDEIAGRKGITSRNNVATQFS